MQYIGVDDEFQNFASCVVTSRQTAYHYDYDDYLLECDDTQLWISVSL